MSDLLSNHKQMLTSGSLISPEIISQRGYRTIASKNELTDIGLSPYQMRVPSLLIPLYRTDGSNGLYILRPDYPRERGSKIIKYEFPSGEKMLIDCHPACQKNLANPAIPLWITEGIKKGDSLASQGLCAISLLGVWNFRGTNEQGGKTILADWDYVALNGRTVYIVFDSDVVKKSSVQKALKSLSAFLRFKKANVKIVYLPDSGNQKIGVDDFLASGHSIEELYELAEEPEVEESKEDYKLIKSSEYMKALNELGYNFRLNDLDDSLEINQGRITDALQAKIRSQMRDKGYTQVNVMQDVYTGFAYDHRYNPIKDYLNNLEWTRQDSINELCNHFTDDKSTADDTCPVFRLWFRKWIIGAVAKVFGREQNPMLVLDGRQDLGKSVFCSWLVPKDLFLAGPINPDDKDSYLRLIKHLVWEVSELGSTTLRRDIEALKSFQTIQEVTVRQPYGHFDLKKPAVASFIGTVNNTGAGFLNDPTGSRRYLVVTLTNIDWDYSKLDPNQLWAQAVTLYKNGERGRLSEEEIALRTKINSTYEVESPIQALIERFYDIVADTGKFFDPPFTATTDIVLMLQNAGIRGSSTKGIQMEVAAILKKAGLQKGQCTVNKEIQRGYWGISLKEEYAEGGETL